MHDEIGAMDAVDHAVLLKGSQFPKLNTATPKVSYCAQGEVILEIEMERQPTTSMTDPCLPSVPAASVRSNDVDKA